MVQRGSTAPMFFVGRSQGVTGHMIEALKDDAILSKFGGRFKLCVLV